MHFIIKLKIPSAPFDYVQKHMTNPLISEPNTHLYVVSGLSRLLLNALYALNLLHSICTCPHHRPMMTGAVQSNFRSLKHPTQHIRNC